VRGPRVAEVRKCQKRPGISGKNNHTNTAYLGHDLMRTTSNSHAIDNNYRGKRALL
jgi:hypothetical protein